MSNIGKKPLIPFVQLESVTPSTKMDELYMQQEYGGYTAPPLSVDAGPGLSTRPNTIDYNLDRPDPSIYTGSSSNDQGPQSLDELLQKAASPTGPSFGGTAFLESDFIGMSRYNSYLPGMDNEDANAQQQSGWTKMVNGLTKMGVLAGTTFLQTTVGSLNGLAQWADTGKFSSFYNNDFNKNLDEVNKSMEDIMATYESKQFRDAKWYSPDYLFTGNFLWEGIVKNLGFALGAAASGYAFGSVMKGLGGLSRAMGAGKIEQAVLAAEEAMALGEGASGYAAKAASFTKEFGGLSNILDKGYRATVAGLATTGEAGIEAYHNLNDYRNKAIERYKEEKGYAPSGRDLEKINEAAEGIGNASFKMNMGLLSVTNYIQFPTILGKSYKANKAIANELAPKIKSINLVDGKYIVQAPSMLKRAGNAIKNPYIFSYSEAMEEGLQFAISQSTEDYYNKKYTDNGDHNSWFDSIKYGLEETLTTDEGMKNILIGGLSGAIMLAPGRVGESIDKAAKTGDALKKFQVSNISNFIKDTRDSVLRGRTLEEEYLNFIDNDDQLNANESENDYVINYLMPRIKYGRHDLVLQEIEDVRTLASSEEGFKQLVEDGKVRESDTREDLLQRLDELESTSLHVAQVYKDLNVKYRGITDSENKRIYTDEVIDKLVYAASKVKFYNDSMPKLENEIGTIEVPYDDIYKGDEKALEKAQLAILDDNTLTNDQAEDKIEKLNRLAVMSQYKKRMLREYNDIKANPENYVTKEVEPVDEEERPAGAEVVKDIIIKTKKYPQGRKYTKGKTYILGNVYEKDKNGNPVYRFPTLKFIGENEDGTVKIETSNGVVRDVSKEVFEDYNLGSEEAVKKSPDARFYKRNANKIVYWNLGKKKGEPIPGRIKWDSVNDNLIFEYKQGKKIIEKVIGIDSFKPKETWFTKGAFYFGEELSVEDKADMADNEKTGRSAEKIAARQAQRAQILLDLYMEVSERHETTEKLIEKKKADLALIKEKLTALKQDISTNAKVKASATKNISFKKVTNEAMAHSLKLTRMIQDLEEEIAALEDQNLSTDETLAYISFLSDSLDELPDDNKEFRKELEGEIITLQLLSTETEKQINAIKSLLKSAKKALADVLAFVGRLVSDFQNRFPDAPTLGAEDFNTYLQEGRGKLLAEDIEDPFSYKEARTQLDELKETINYVQTEDVPVAQSRVDALLDHLAIMEQDAQDLEKQARAVQTVIDKFKTISDEIKAVKAEQEALLLNGKLQEEIIGTLDDAVPSHPGNDGYEANAKKNKAQVAGSTTVSSDFKEPHVVRTNKFAFDFKKFKNKHKIKSVVVTAATEDNLIPGLMAHIKNEAEKKGKKVDVARAIFSVFVEVAKDGSYELVGVDGQPLTETQKADAVNHAVYQPHPLPELKAQYPDGQGGFTTEDMFRKEVTEDERKAVRAKYVEWREAELARTELPEPRAMIPSFGTPVYEDDNKNAKVPVLDSKLITKTELEDEPRQVLQVATLNTKISNNGVVYETPKGRVFLNIAEGLVPLNATKLGKDKGTTVYKVLHAIAVDLATNKKVTTDSKLMIDWLRTVVQWGTPKTKTDADGNIIDSEPGFSSVWFDYVNIKQPDGTTSREPRLFISGLGFNMPFTPTELAKNSTKIADTLANLYHNVSNKYTDVSHFNNEYDEIVDVKDGKPVWKDWANYQTYLLSGEGRKTSDIPLTSAFKALVEDDDVNREGIYFTFTDAEEIYGAEQEDKTTPLETKEAQEKKEEQKKQDKRVTTVPVFDNTTDNVWAHNNGITYALYRTNAEGKITSFQLFDWDNIKKAMKEKYGVPEYYNPAIADFTPFMKDKVQKEVVDPAFELKQEPPVTTEADGTFYDDEWELEDGEDPLAGGVIDEDPDDFYRIATQDPYEVEENFNEVEQHAKKVLPNVPFFRVKNIIKATKNRKALGMFHKGAIYIWENAEIGTGYHEIFEAVWKTFTTPAEQKAIADEFRSRQGTFEDRESGKIIKYSEASSQELKEELAEEYRRMRMKRVKASKTLIGRIFQQISDYIKDFLTSFQDNPSLVEAMFKAIDKGNYASYDRYNSTLENINNTPGIIKGYQYIDEIEGDENSVYRLESRIKVPTRQLNDLMQHMSYSTIVNLFKEDVSIVDSNSYTKAELYYELRKEVNRILSNRKATLVAARKKAINAKNREVSASLKRQIDELYQLDKDIAESWDAIVDRHIENLQTYNIIFDENDHVLLHDEDNSGREDYIDGRKIDPLKKASAAVKLMLATIPEIDSKTGLRKKSSVNGYVMMDIGEAFIHLMEELHTAADINDMMVRLNKLSNYYPSYKYLYQRLTREHVTSISDPNDVVMPPAFTNMTANGFELLSSFWRTFKKQRPDIITVFRLEDGTTVVTDTSLTSSAKQAQYNLRNNLINAIKSKKGNGLFAANKGKYTAVKRKGHGFDLVNLDPADAESYTSFLNKVGINFTVGDVNRLNESQRKAFFKNTEGLRNELLKIEDVSTISKKTINAENDLFNLGILRAVLDNEEFQSTYFNVNGEMSQTFIGPNALSSFYHAIGHVKNRKQLSNTIYSYLNTDVFSKNSLILKRLFSKTDDQNKLEGSESIMRPIFVDGSIDEQAGKSTDSSRLKFVQRIVQEINANLQGIYMNLVPGDASIEWGVKMHEKEKAFVTEQRYASKKFLEIFEGYLIDEINLVRANRPTVVKKHAKMLRFFDDMLSDDLKAKILSATGTASEVVYTKEINEQFRKEVQEFIVQDAKDNIELLQEYNLLVDNKGEWHSSKINFNEGNPMGEDFFYQKMEVLSANYMIANIELHKLIYSDPYQYSDELKRIKSFSSPRQALIHGSSTLNTSLDRIYNENYKPSDRGWSDMKREFLRAVTLADIWSINKTLAKHSKELALYGIPYEETDGGGITTIKAKRKIMLRAGLGWNERLERQYRFDIAYEDFFLGKELTDEQLEIFDPENPLRLDPGVQDLYTPLKPIVSGRKGNDRNYNDVLLDKFALLPISFKLMHVMDKENNMLALYNKMQKEDIDYAVFSSGRKVGAEKRFNPYDENGKISEVPFQSEEEAKNNMLPQAVINVPFSIIAIQTEVPTKEEGGTTQGSQITKLATLDTMEAGVPIDFVVEGTDDISDRYNAWISLTEGIRDFEKAEDIRANNSTLYKEIVNNRRLLDAKVKIGYRKLTSKLGITRNSKGELRITKRNRMANTLRDEIFSRDVNENISEAFKGFLAGDVILEGTPLYQQIRNILFSIARKNVIRPKINGGFKVQMFNTFFEKNRISKEKDGKGNDVYTSGDLNFYVDEDGQRVCEIMVEKWFDSPLSDDELIEWLNSTEEGKKVLEGIGYRIPTQKQNSIDAFRIKKFLPKGMKDTVIVPVDLVRKVGSDFDIDKLSVYLKNVLGGRKPKLLQFLTNENSTAEERYFEWIKDIAGYDTKSYFRFLAKDEVKTIRLKYKKSKAENTELYKEQKAQIKENYKPVFESMFNLKKEWKSDQDESMLSLFEDGATYFWQLSEKTMKHFTDLKTRMRRDDINGSVEIENYLALAQVQLSRVNTPAQDKLALMRMIENYKEELEVLGYTNGEIAKIQEGIEQIKQTKSEAIEDVINEIIRAGQATQALYEGEIDQVNLKWAQEVAAVEGLETLDAFKELDIYEQNASMNLDNAYIESIFNLTTHPLNFKRLLVPNSAKQAKDLSDKIRKLLGKEKIDYGKPINMMRRKFMAELRQAFVSGKYAIGISAVGQTNHAQNQRTLIYLDETKLKNLSYLDSLYLTDVVVNFKYHNQINGKVSLSGIKSAGKNGDYISDIIGQFIDGYVDISKGPWIMELGATSNVAGLWLFLLKIGVPFNDVAFFMNQPIIREYIKNLDSEGLSTLHSKPNITAAMDAFAHNSKIKIEQIPSASELEKMIGKKVSELSPEQKAQQQYMLVEMLKYAKMSEHLLTYVQGSNFDTANFNDPLLVGKKKVQLEQARNSIISSVDENLEASFVGPLFETIQDARDGFSDLLVSDQSGEPRGQIGPREVIHSILKPYISPYINDKKYIKIGRKVVENLFDWAMQTGSQLNAYIQRSFFEGSDGTPSVIQQVIDFRDEVKRNQNHPLFGNIVINNLELVPSSRDGQPDSITIKAKQNKVFNQNLVINAFREIEDYLEEQGSDLYDKFMQLAILQSGLTNSYLSFTNLLPYEVFTKHYNSFLTMLGSNPDLEDFLALNEFQRTNPTDTDIVPVLKAKDGLVPDWTDQLGGSFKYWNTATTFVNENLKKAMQVADERRINDDLDYHPFPKIINVSTWDMVSGNEVISWWWEDIPLTRDDIKKGIKPWRKKAMMKAKGDFSYLKKGLFQKVYTYNQDGERIPLIQINKVKKKGKTVVYENYVYKAINTRGFGPRIQEHYSKLVDKYSGEILGRRSRIDNDFINVTEVSDKRIVEIFNGSFDPTPRGNTKKLTQAPIVDNFPVSGNKLIKEIKKLDAKYFIKSQRLVVGRYTFDKKFAESGKPFIDKLVSLGYSEEQIGALKKLTC